MPKLWTPPTENQFSVSENTQMLFPNSITQTQIFEFWVMETSTQNQTKHKIFCGTHAFWKLSDENWVISLKINVIQKARVAWNQQEQRTKSWLGRGWLQLCKSYSIRMKEDVCTICSWTWMIFINYYHINHVRESIWKIFY